MNIQPKRLIRPMILILLISLFSITLTVSGQEQETWLIQLIINEDINNGQVVDGLILDENILVPIDPVIALLQISIIEKDNNLISFTRPGDKAKIMITQQQININDQQTEQNSVLLKDGQLYLEIKQLGELVDAEITYKTEEQAIYIDSTHVAKPETIDHLDRFMNKYEDAAEEKINAGFSISNINYDLDTSWYDRDVTLRDDQEEVNVPDLDSGSESEDNLNEGLTTILRLNMEGRLNDWQYQIGIESTLEPDQPTDSDLTQLRFVNYQDTYKTELGMLSVRPYNELKLNDYTYYGLARSSLVSPTMRYNGNLIDISGEAPAGSYVTLYIDDWKVATQWVKDDEQYYFKDVVLFETSRASEIRISIKNPTGSIEDEFRYIAASDAILSPGEINYLAEIGRLKSDESDSKYLWNLVGYWGADEDSTFGMSLYGEVDNKLSFTNPNFAHYSLSYNQRFTDYTTWKNTIYQAQFNENGLTDNDSGYKTNLDYRDSINQAGIEYYKEIEQFNLIPEDRLEPSKVIRGYYLRDITPDSTFSSSYSNRKQVDNPRIKDELYELGYRITQEKWRGSLGFRRDIKQQDLVTPSSEQTDTWDGFLSYLITPAVELTGEFIYEQPEYDYNNANLDLETVIQSGPGAYKLGIGHYWELEGEEYATSYRLSRLHKWVFGKDGSLQAELGYEYIKENDNTTERVPLDINYAYILPSQARLNLDYQGAWWQDDLKKGLENSVSLSLEGSVNLFDGKIVSTNPLPTGIEIGMVSGKVFRDSNRNGILDEGEHLITGIPVLLGRKREVSDDNGEFTFKEVPAQTYLLKFDYTQLPIEFTPSTMEQRIEVKPNNEVFVNLGLYTVGTIDGQLIPANGQENLNLSGIKLTAQPGEYTTLTDGAGYYFFDQMPPGTYTISIVDSTLPEWVDPRSLKSNQVTVTEKGEYIIDINFILESK